MSKSFTTNNKFKKASATNTINEDTIDALWVMGGASVIHDDNNKTEIVGYACYCDACKTKSSSGNGGIIFATAEELLDHRKMKAFKCPCGCGFHVCEERGSIMRHLKCFHEEVLTKLQKEGLDSKKSWIYPDEMNNTYTLSKPMPNFEDKSALDQTAMILSLSLTPPKRVWMAPSPNIPSPVPSESPVPFIKKDSSKLYKSWDKINKPQIKSFNELMTEQKVKNEESTESTEQLIHYAQEDMRKEKQCSYGVECIKKDRPFACALNHDGKGDIIKMGTILTDDILCPFERPPLMRCHNGRCTKIHLENRADFIEKEKKIVFEKKKYNQSSNNSVQNEPVASSVMSITKDGMTFTLSAEDAYAVAAAHYEVNGTKLILETEEPFIEPNNNKHQKPVENDDEDSDDSTHELRDAHQNKMRQYERNKFSFLLDA